MKLKWTLLTFVLAGCLVGCSATEKKPTVDKKQVNPLVTAHSWEIYIPPVPVAPATHNESLGFAIKDKSEPYVVHAVAVDRDTLYDMFPPKARFYALNVTQLWFWGDGTSDTGASFTHAYPGEGTYTLTVFHDVYFRGGVTRRITSCTNIILREQEAEPVIQISSPPTLTGNPQMPLERHRMSARNIGGGAVVLEPRIEKVHGTINDLSWIYPDTDRIVVRNDGCPVYFNIVMDWPNSTEGTLEIVVKFKQNTITTGWDIPWVSG